MARLNELPVSSDSLETLRKKMLRQNRDLAKSNNIRALRIRELENECACMLSENLGLRSRILELEKQVEDSESRRIADHAMAIKAKLESQLTEWGTLIAGLGLEPPIKRHSPVIRKTTKQRMSYGGSRPSPSQRRLREIARDVEELGHISENKACPRQSMNPEQILALRSEADISVDSPELGPPPMSKFIDEDPVKVDSPSRVAHEKLFDHSPMTTPKARKLQPPVAFPSPTSEPDIVAASPLQKKLEATRDTTIEAEAVNIKEVPSPVQPIKAGSKRKLAARDDIENVQSQRPAYENNGPRVLAETTVKRERGRGRPPKALGNIKKEAEPLEKVRKPLAAKSTNDDISSPMKGAKTKAATGDEVAAAKAKAIAARSRPTQDKTKPTARSTESIKNDAPPVPEIETAPQVSVDCDLAVPIAEPGLLSPSSPEVAAPLDAHRGDTPPPADISSSGETSRPSRRNRTAVSYAEPNLRDKMRRPTKELFDAVAGEGKYARRTSQIDPATLEHIKAKRESNISEVLKQTPVIPAASTGKEPNTIPASPLAAKLSSVEDLPSSVVTERRRRPSNVAPKPLNIGGLDSAQGQADHTADTSTTTDSSGLGDVDVYEFTSSSPPSDKEEVKDTKRNGRRQTTSSRRSTLVAEEDNGLGVKERNTSRRRSMMV